MYSFVFLFSLILFSNAANPKKIDHTRFLSSRPKSAPPSFDCAVRKYAFEYAQKIQPFLSTTKRSQVFDSLELSSMCGQKFEELLNKQHEKPPHVKDASPPRETTTFFVDSVRGYDENPGSYYKPFRSLPAAIQASRRVSGHRTIYLREGTHYLSETLNLGPQDSHLLISAYKGEAPVLSGGIPLSISSWVPYQVDSSESIQLVPGNNIYKRIDGPRTNTTTIRFIGAFSSVEGCQAACLNFREGNVQCNAFTYFPPSYKNYASDCYAEITNVWGPAVDSNGAISGRRVRRNVYSTDLSKMTNLTSITGLRVNGKRAIRAKYPNSDPELQYFPDGFVHDTASWGPVFKFPKAVTIRVPQPNRKDVSAQFGEYSVGVGGPCSVFSPPESYWCSEDNNGGGAALYSMISGLNYLPGTFQGRNLNFSRAIVHLFHWAHWAMWMFEVDKYNLQNNSIGWTKGGFQGARGEAGFGGSEWHIENIFGEVDSPNEYYFNETTKRLYYFNNGTTAPAPSTQFVATNLKILVNIEGTQDNPVVGVKWSGVTFRDTAYTYMDPHGVPSGGDWSMQRSAAVVVKGAEDTLFDACLFERCDGHGIAILGYNRNLTVQKSEFAWIGDSPIMSWGDTIGIDGTDGNHPRFTQILYNFFREFGIYQKQASPYFQAKSCLSLIKGNIAFNGPRALINFNDGFGGGNEMVSNLLYNANRETSDQGPFNSWDRLPYLTDVLTGLPSLIPAMNNLHHNFMIANYGSNMCIDNDDGSAYYLNHHNFEVYGGHKSDWGGHDKFTYGAINAYSQVYQDGVCASYNPEWIVGHNDGYWENRCIQSPTAPYQIVPSCDPDHFDARNMPESHSNQIYNNDLTLTVICGDSRKNKTFTEEEVQALGWDPLTAVYPIPDDDTVIQWAKQLLNEVLD